MYCMFSVSFDCRCESDMWIFCRGVHFPFRFIYLFVCYSICRCVRVLFLVMCRCVSSYPSPNTSTSFHRLSFRFLPLSLSPFISYMILSSFVTPRIHRSVLISATSNWFSCAFFNAHVPAPYTSAGLTTVLFICVFVCMPNTYRTLFSF